MMRLVYEGQVEVDGPTHPATLQGAINYALMLASLEGRGSADAVSFLRERLLEAESALGDDHQKVWDIRLSLGTALVKRGYDSPAELQEAAELLENVTSFFRRVLGASHPKTNSLVRLLHFTRKQRAELEATSDDHL